MIWLTEFRQIFIDSELINKFINEREINVIFNVSMLTCIDEMNYEKFLLLNFNEFQEALARSSEKISFNPVGFSV